MSIAHSSNKLHILHLTYFIDKSGKEKRKYILYHNRSQSITICCSVNIGRYLGGDCFSSPLFWPFHVLCTLELLSNNFCFVIYKINHTYGIPLNLLMCADSSTNNKIRVGIYLFMDWQTSLFAWFSKTAVTFDYFMIVCVISYCLGLWHPPRRGGGGARG